MTWEQSDFLYYQLIKNKTHIRILKNTPHLGVAFSISKNILNSVTDIKPINNRPMTISLKCANKFSTIINGHMPVNEESMSNGDTVKQIMGKLGTYNLKNTT